MITYGIIDRVWKLVSQFFSHTVWTHSLPLFVCNNLEVVLAVWKMD